MKTLFRLRGTALLVFLVALLLVLSPSALAQASTQLVLNPVVSSVTVGNSVVVSIDVASVSNLYGYQFQVTYDASKVSASGAFVNSFFNTTAGTFIPSGWNANCAAGVCKFAATHLNTASPVTGSGTLAQITFTGVSTGNVPLAFGSDILADRDGNAMAHTSGTANVLVNPAPGGTSLLFNPVLNTVAVGNSVVVSIDLAAVTSLYGYQFQVTYDASKVSASGAFVNTFFDTASSTFIPGGWNANCSGGVCKFAASHLNTAPAVTGSGTLAQIMFTGISAGTTILSFSADILSDRDGNVLSHTNGVASITVYVSPPGGTTLAFNPLLSSVAVGNNVVVSIDLAAVTDLYGYQFQVTYDASKVSASGAFVNPFFDTTSNTYIPAGWSASCTSGVCQFAATHLNTAGPVSGSGTLAQITFMGVSAGNVPLVFSADILADRDGNPIAHTSGTATINVYGFATISGIVALQGRATPISVGTVTLTDNANLFPPTIVNFSATTGAFTVVVPVDASGSNYKLRAAHSLYLWNERAGVAVVVGGTYPQPATILRAGDGTNDGVVDVLDLSCAGGRFGLSPATCAVTGNSDMNEDGIMDILDLVLAGGNFGLFAPRPW